MNSDDAKSLLTYDTRRARTAAVFMVTIGLVVDMATEENGANKECDADLRNRLPAAAACAIIRYVTYVNLA